MNFIREVPGRNSIYQLTGTCHCPNKFGSKNLDKKSPKWRSKIRAFRCYRIDKPFFSKSKQSQSKTVKLHICITKTLKTHSKFCELPFLSRNWSKNPDLVLQKETIFSRNVLKCSNGSVLLKILGTITKLTNIQYFIWNQKLFWLLPVFM